MASPIPHSLEMEQAVLGACLQDSQGIALERASSILKPEDFYHDAHRMIFAAMLALSERREPVDFQTVPHWLSVNGWDGDWARGPYMSQLMDAVASPASVEYYARIVADKADLRRIQGAGKVLEVLALADYEDIAEVKDKAQAAVMDATETRSSGEVTHIGRVLDEVIAEAERLAQGGDRMTGLRTGWDEIDFVTAGWQREELIIIGARTSIGKSAFALQTALHVAANAGPVVYFNLEMGKHDFGRRLLSMDASIGMHRLRTGYLTREQHNSLSASRKKIDAAKLFIDSSTDVNTLEMRNRLRRVKREHGLSMVVVDYLQLVPPRRRYESRYMEVGEVSRDLVRMAKEFRVPVIAPCQLKRGADEKRRPQLADLRESGNLEQDARTVLFIHRPKFNEDENSPPDKDPAEVIIAKQSNGPRGVIVDMWFRGEFTRFDAKTGSEDDEEVRTPYKEPTSPVLSQSTTSYVSKHDPFSDDFVEEEPQGALTEWNGSFRP